MKMMWFTLWRVPADVAPGTGVGVGLVPTATIPWQPVRTRKKNRARQHAGKALLKTVINPNLAKI
jgi:hypothetical protein